MIRSIIKKSTLNIYLSEEIDQQTGNLCTDLVYGSEFQDDIKNVVLSINSAGGSVMYANDIINACKKSTKNIITRIEGVAASSAFLIWLSTPVENRQITSNALSMMHNPSNSDDSTLSAFKSSIETYISNATDIEKNSISLMMNATTWMDSNEMVQMGMVKKENVIKSSRKYKFEIFNALMNITNKFMSDDIYIVEENEEIEIKNNIEEMEKIEFEKIINEQKETIEKLSSELDAIKEIENKKQLEIITNQKLELLKDVENKESFMKFDIEDIKMIVNSLNKKVIIESPKLDIKNENIKINNIESLESLSLEEKNDLYVNDREKFNKLFYKK